MNKRPRSITVISWLFIAVGIIALVYHLQPEHIAEVRAHLSFGNELLWICVIRILAVVSGAFMLAGYNWARWLLVVWIAYHVVLSAFHSLFEVTVHGVLFAIVAYFLFCRPASSFFRARSAGSIRSAPEEHTLD